jgi:hypothetical protein
MANDFTVENEHRNLRFPLAIFQVIIQNGTREGRSDYV